MSFRALVVTKDEGKVSASVQELTSDRLPEGDVLVRIAYSSLNYKDGLALAGNPGVVRNFPMVPGIDFAGVVEQSASPDFSPGDSVVLTGWGVGERHWGGYSQYARVKSAWLVPLPAGLTPLQAMAVGTAGFTAVQCVDALESHGARPGGKDIAVTGACGGVGSVAIAVLAKRGFRVVASTGRSDLADYLRGLGAAEVIDRAVLATQSAKPMEAERWGGAVDSVGGDTLAGLIRTMSYGCPIACCGLAGGTALATTVLPFILRGVKLLGVDSAQCSKPERLRIWQRVVADLPHDALSDMTRMTGLAELPAEGKQILAGQTRGRVVVDVNA